MVMPLAKHRFLEVRLNIREALAIHRVLEKARNVEVKSKEEDLEKRWMEKGADNLLLAITKELKESKIKLMEYRFNG